MDPYIVQRHNGWWVVEEGGKVYSGPFLEFEEADQDRWLAVCGVSWEERQRLRRPRVIMLPWQVVLFLVLFWGTVLFFIVRRFT